MSKNIKHVCGTCARYDEEWSTLMGGCLLYGDVTENDSCGHWTDDENDIWEVKRNVKNNEEE